MHHAKHEGLVMTSHILAGIFVLALAPFLAYLCIPPAQRLESTFAFMSENEEAITTVAATLLIVVNLSVLFLVPHPTRSGEYRNKCPHRFYIKAITNIHSGNLSFLAMTLMAVAVSSDAGGMNQTVWIPELSAVCLSLLATCIYISTIISAFLAFKDSHLEAFPLVKSYILPCMPKGVKSRSNMIGIPPGEDLGEAQAGLNISLIIFVMVDAYAAVEGFFIFVHSAFPGVLGLSRPEQQLERFYVIMVLYMSLVMNAGFFVLAQNDKTKWVIVADVILTQFLPVLLTFIGPAWMQGNGSSSFLWQLTFWSS